MCAFLQGGPNTAKKPWIGKVWIITDKLWSVLRYIVLHILSKTIFTSSNCMIWCDGKTNVNKHKGYRNFTAMLHSSCKFVFLNKYTAPMVYAWGLVFPSFTPPRAWKNFKYLNLRRVRKLNKNLSFLASLSASTFNC